jgi:hypothetical protein
MGIHIIDPKGGPDQKIPLNDAARELLENHSKSNSPYVFPGRGGRRRTNITKGVNAIKAAANLPIDFRPPSRSPACIRFNARLKRSTMR